MGHLQVCERAGDALMRRVRGEVESHSKYKDALEIEVRGLDQLIQWGEGGAGVRVISVPN